MQRLLCRFKIVQDERKGRSQILTQEPKAVINAENQVTSLETAEVLGVSLIKYKDKNN